MGLLDWLFGGKPKREFGSAPIDWPASSPDRSVARVPRDDFAIRLRESSFDPDGDESDLMWYGLLFEKANGHPLYYNDPEITDLGMIVFNVAGTSYRKAALQKPCFDLYSFVRLAPEGGNKFDANAVAVHDESGRVHVGYVPRDLAKLMRRAIAERPTYAAMVIGNATKDGRRVSLKVLFGPEAGLRARGF